MTDISFQSEICGVADAFPGDDHLDQLLASLSMPGDEVLTGEGEHVPLDDGGAFNGLSKRKPLKQLIASLRESTRPCIQIYVAGYDRELRKEKARQRALENKERKVSRAAERAAPARAIEEEGRRRLRLLELALRHRHGDKLLEQLAGRAEDLTDFWVASKLAALKNPSGRACDRDIGEHFATRSGTPCNKDQARTRRKLTAQLELRGIWVPVSQE